jgi:Zn-dependent peptidase ImmA (M78 family)/transcriptional regulator with XRE-family HTH domain
LQKLDSQFTFGAVDWSGRVMKELSDEQVEFAVTQLKRHIESRGYTQVEVQELSGVSQPTISKTLYTREVKPTVEQLGRLCKSLLGFSLHALLDIDSPPEFMFGYLATPLTGLAGDDNGNSHLTVTIARIKEIAGDAEFEDPPFDLYWPGDYTHPVRNSDLSPEAVYITDRTRASTNDFVVMLCAAPSYGVGQENEIATQVGKPIIRLVPEKLSRMMSGSFARVYEVKFSGSLAKGIHFNADDLKAALRQVRITYYRHRALYHQLVPSEFGVRLKHLVDERIAHNTQFAEDIGISMPYLMALFGEPLEVSNPGAQLLRRMAARLDVSVGHLLGEAPETDPIWIESHNSLREWVEKNPTATAACVFEIRDERREQYRLNRYNVSTASFRARSHAPKPQQAMRYVDWEKMYRARQKGGLLVLPENSSEILSSALVRAFNERTGGDSPEMAITQAVAGLRRKIRTRHLSAQLQEFIGLRKVKCVVEANGLESEGYLEPLGTTYSDGFTIHIRRSSPHYRRRFTIAHELCHTFFYEFVPEMKFVVHTTDAAEERLCDLGAAELLMPAFRIKRAASRTSPSLRALAELSDTFAVSMEAIILRLNHLGLWNCELTSWLRDGSGRFLLDRAIGLGPAKHEWSFLDEAVLQKSWDRRVSITGRTFLKAQTELGRELRPVWFDLQRRGNRVVCLFCRKSPKPQRPSGLFTDV